MSANDFWGPQGPARYSAEQPFWYWQQTRALDDKAVWMNNHTVVARFATAAEASLDAARRNYEANSYPRPSLLGI
jgi:hypothetical protein